MSFAVDFFLLQTSSSYHDVAVIAYLLQLGTTLLVLCLGDVPDRFMVHVAWSRGIKGFATAYQNMPLILRCLTSDTHTKWQMFKNNV
jgi:hypothetical protein